VLQPKVDLPILKETSLRELALTSLSEQEITRIAVANYRPLVAWSRRCEPAHCPHQGASQEASRYRTGLQVLDREQSHLELLQAETTVPWPSCCV
jgi:hypothetical protein